MPLYLIDDDAEIEGRRLHAALLEEARETVRGATAHIFLGECKTG